MKITNDLILGVVKNWCDKNLTIYNDKYTIEILDFINMPLTHEEVDLIYSHIQKGTAVDFVREWYISERGYDTGKAAQQVVAKKIQEFFNVNILRKSKYHVDKKVFNAILYWLGNVSELAMPEDAIIETVREFVEDGHI